MNDSHTGAADSNDTLVADWQQLNSVFERDDLERLLGVRVAAEAQKELPLDQPNDLPVRVSFLAELIAVLSKSYTLTGVRQWFYRPRTPLGGQSPISLLSGEWRPGQDPARMIQDLARTTLI
jgi:hypothetical protein